MLGCFDDFIVSLVFRLILIGWSSQSNLCPISSSISPRSIWIIWPGIGWIPGEPALGTISRNTKKFFKIIFLSNFTVKQNWTLPEFFNSNVLPSNYWCKNDQCNAENQNHSKLSRIFGQATIAYIIGYMVYVISYWVYLGTILPISNRRYGIYMYLISKWNLVLLKNLP